MKTNIKELRKAQNITLPQLAVITGINKGKLS